MRVRNPSDTVVGVAWYSRECWTKLRASAPDPEGLEPTYEDWVLMFDDAVAKIRAAGVHPERVAVEFEAFSEWCRVEGLELNSSARADYASEQLRLRHVKSRGSDV